ncbi:MAG: hypothetical protein ACM3RP_00035 [Chitinophagales bacterium]
MRTWLPISACMADGTQVPVKLDRYPDDCPICKRVGTPRFVTAFLDDLPDRNIHDPHSHKLQAVFRCPSQKCRSVFFAEYRCALDHEYHGWLAGAARPSCVEVRQFSQTISSLSPMFCRIYRQAQQAEANGYLLICGPGYRKALEFLVKDFLIQHAFKDDPPKQEQVKDVQLGPCIGKFVEDERIKKVAERAAWLGNDETHYVRKWQDRDLEDLKHLIHLTVNFVENAVDFDAIMAGMPNGK